MSNMFKINGVLANASNVENVIRANQNDSFATDTQDSEILYYENGAPVSSSDLTFSNSTLTVGGQTEIDGGKVSVGYSDATDKRGITLDASASSFAYMDFNSRNGGENDFDVRLVTAGGETGQNGTGTLNVQSSAVNFFSQISTQPGPAFKVDFASTPAVTGSNQVTTISLTPGLFSVPPTVVCTANTPTGSTGDQSVHVEEVTTSSFKVEYLGTAAAGTSINWIALGI